MKKRGPRDVNTNGNQSENMVVGNLALYPIELTTPHSRIVTDSNR